MLERTIYTHMLNTRDFEPKELMSVSATEARTCEQLLNMGFTHSNGVDLKARFEFLAQRVARLDKFLRAQAKRPLEQ